MQVRRVAGACAVAGLFLSPCPTSAQTQPDVRALQDQIDQLKKEFGDRITALETKLAEAQAAAAAAAPQVSTAGVPITPGVTGGQTAAVANAKVFNPDISVMGNVIGVGGQNDHSDQPTFDLSEVEVGFQSVIDAYARADFFLSASPEGVEVEEGFATFTALPAGLLLKAGKLRAEFGKINRIHTHLLSWADRPLVTQNLVGGDEGISMPGVSVSKLIQNPVLFLEAIGETYYGSSDVFQSNPSHKSKLTYIGRLRGYRDISEAVNLDIGGSYGFGPSAQPFSDARTSDSSTELIGIDATLRYRPLRTSSSRRLLARTELVWSRTKFNDVSGERAFGYYASGDYQFARRWIGGVRYDRSAHALNPSLIDTGGSLLLTFRPSEFSVVRGQYRRTNYGDGIKANEFLFQVNFAIGAHAAHAF